LQRSLRLLQIPSPEDLADLPKDAKRLGPLDENYLVCSPEPAPLKVYQEQDDVAHLETHLHFLVSPMFGANPLIGSVAFGAMMPHIKDHLMAFYKKHTQGAADALQMIAPAMGATLTRAQAEAKGAAFADQVMVQLLGPMIMPAMQQAQQLAAQFAPKPQIDPAVQAQIASQESIAKLNAEARAQEAQRERDFKMQSAEKDRQFKEWLEGSKQDANDRATTMATAIEQHALETQRQLAEFNASELARREAEAARQEAYRQQLKADNDAQFAILQAMLQQQAASPPPQIDIASIIQPALQDMKNNMHDILVNHLGQGLQVLQAAHTAPRVARYIKDELGNNVGVESIIKGSQS